MVVRVLAVCVMGLKVDSVPVQDDMTVVRSFKLSSFGGSGGGDKG